MNAIDHDISTYTHTAYSSVNPWWQLDFGTEVYVQNISVINRGTSDDGIGESIAFSTPIACFQLSFNVGINHTGS